MKTEPRFMAHVINSYEIGNSTIVIDYTTCPDLQIISDLGIDSMLDPVRRNKVPYERCQIRRFVLHLDVGKIDVIKFKSRNGLEFLNKFDMPSINENYLYRKYCVVYGLAPKADGKCFANTTLVKKNMCGNNQDMYWNEPYHYPSEPTFVPRPNAVDEDDGILLDVILDGKKRKSYIGIFDAKTMKRVNKGYLPVHIPYVLHGRFFE